MQLSLYEFPEDENAAHMESGTIEMWTSETHTNDFNCVSPARAMYSSSTCRHSARWRAFFVLRASKFKSSYCADTFKNLKKKKNHLPTQKSWTHFEWPTNISYFVDDFTYSIAHILLLFTRFQQEMWYKSEHFFRWHRLIKWPHKNKDLFSKFEHLIVALLIISKWNTVECFTLIKTAGLVS